MIIYTQEIDTLSESNVTGFFVGWPNPPDSKTLIELLGNSERILAISEDSGQLVGFITAVTDGILSAYIPLLEVLPGFQGNGIGASLVKKMMVHLNELYMIDLICDEELVPFYTKLGLSKSTGMIHRNYSRQTGKK